MYGYRSPYTVRKSSGSWWLMVALLAATVSQAAAGYYTLRALSSFNAVLGPSRAKIALDSMVDWQVLFSDLNRGQFWENAADVTCIVGVLLLLVWFNMNGKTWGRPSMRILTVFALGCTIAAAGIRVYVTQAMKQSTADLVPQFADSLFPEFGATILAFQEHAPLQAAGYAFGAAACVFLFLFVGSVARQG